MTAGQEDYIRDILLNYHIPLLGGSSPSPSSSVFSSVVVPSATAVRLIALVVAAVI